MKSVIQQDPVIQDHYLTPSEISKRWKWHAESVRRAIRRGDIASIVIGRRRLVLVKEVLRIEAAGRVNA